MGSNKPQRSYRVSFMLNEHEYKVIEKYLKKYKIENKSNLFRTAVMSHVVKRMVDDYPTLFDESEMR